MPRAPFMQLFPADFLSGTLHLTTEQVGAYTLIFLAMWTAGGSLPNDPAKLARIARLSPQRWTRVGADVLQFFQHDGDAITQERLKRDIEKVYSIVEKRSAAGKLGNEAKLLKSRNAPQANANAKPKRSECILEPELKPEPEPEPEEEDENLTALPLNLPAVQQTRKQPRKGKSKISREVLEPEFQSFMRQYPKPIDEDDARTEYFKARRTGRATAEDILNGALRYAAERTGEDPKYIKAPQNWLRAGSWKNPTSTAPTRMTNGNTEIPYAAIAGFNRRPQ